MAGVDRGLLDSPYPEDRARGFPLARVVLGIFLVLLATAITLWMIDRAGGTPVASESTTTAAGAPVVLAAYAPEPPILTHPRVLPEGWAACSLTDDRFDPDRFCGADVERWVEVSYAFARPTNPETAVPAGLHDGVWVSQSEPLELRFPVNEHVDLTLKANGLERQQALDIAGSIPILSNLESLYGIYEIPIDWEAMHADDLVGLLDQFEDDATVDLGRFELTVRTSNASLYGFNSRGYWTPAAATDLPMARLVEADRPLVVGASDDLKRGYAVWDQAGFSWRLEGNLDAEEMTALALSVIAKLRELPLDRSG